jgi:hypothetical protein
LSSDPAQRAAQASASLAQRSADRAADSTANTTHRSADCSADTTRHIAEAAEWPASPATQELGRR